MVSKSHKQHFCPTIVLTHKLTEIWWQVEYREQSKGKIARQLEISGKTATDEELEAMLEGGGGARLTGHIQIEGNEDQLRATINDIEQR